MRKLQQRGGGGRILWVSRGLTVRWLYCCCHESVGNGSLAEVEPLLPRRVWSSRSWLMLESMLACFQVDGD